MNLKKIFIVISIILVFIVLFLKSINFYARDVAPEIADHARDVTTEIADHAK
jgi:hypothetical protein